MNAFRSLLARPGRLARFLEVVIIFATLLGCAVLLAGELPADTNKIESLTPEQARELAKDFPGVVVEIETKGLGKTRLEACLPLNGLKSLDAETAKVLAGYGKGRLLLNGLTTLNADTAKALAQFKGVSLALNGLTKLDVDAAKALAEVKVQWLDLAGLTTLDAATAKAIAEFKGDDLCLKGLTTLDAETAKALAAFKGGRLSLQGLHTLVSAHHAHPLRGAGQARAAALSPAWQRVGGRV